MVRPLLGARQRSLGWSVCILFYATVIVTTKVRGVNALDIGRIAQLMVAKTLRGVDTTRRDAHKKHQLESIRRRP